MNEATNIIDELRAAVGDREFSSLVDAQAFLNSFTESRNQATLDDFAGLSPAQMTRLLSAPYNSPDLVELPPCLQTVPIGPAIELFGVLAEAIGENGVKSTATGNLPAKLVRDLAATVMRDDGYKEFTDAGSIRSETDYADLHALRITAQISKLIRKYKGRFLLSQEARRVLASQGLAGIYPRLLRAYTTEFNWGYRDGYPDYPIIQRSFLFTLWLLDRYGDQWRPNTFYEDAFLKAFPQVLAKADNEWRDPLEKSVRRCYSLRSLDRFASFLGLAETELSTDDFWRNEFQIRSTPLLNEAVRFHGGSSKRRRIPPDEG